MIGQLRKIYTILAGSLPQVPQRFQHMKSGTICSDNLEHHMQSWGCLVLQAFCNSSRVRSLHYPLVNMKKLQFPCHKFWYNVGIKILTFTYKSFKKFFVILDCVTVCPLLVQHTKLQYFLFQIAISP